MPCLKYIFLNGIKNVHFLGYTEKIFDSICDQNKELLFYYWLMFDYNILSEKCYSFDIALYILKKNKVSYKLTHETCRIVGVSSNLAIDFNQTLHYNLCYFAISQCIFQPIAKKNNKRKGFS